MHQFSIEIKEKVMWFTKCDQKDTTLIIQPPIKEKCLITATFTIKSLQTLMTMKFIYKFSTI